MGQSFASRMQEEDRKVRKSDRALKRRTLVGQGLFLVGEEDMTTRSSRSRMKERPREEMRLKWGKEQEVVVSLRVPLVEGKLLLLSQPLGEL